MSYMSYVSYADYIHEKEFVKTLKLKIQLNTWFVS